MKQYYLFLNNKQINPEQLESVYYFDEPSANIFESVRTYDGHPFLLKQHLERLRASAKTAGFSLKKTEKQITEELHEYLNQLPRQEYFIRITLLPKGLSFLFIPGKKYSSHIFKTGVVVRTVPTHRNHVNSIPPGVKSSNFLNQVLGLLEKGKGGVFEILFLSSTGELQEACTWNFFIVKQGVLKTPSAQGLLGGVTRSFVIELASFLKLPVQETVIMRLDAFNADEAFLTNTSGEIVPIREWDGRTIGGGKPGPITKKLMRAFKQRVKVLSSRT